MSIADTIDGARRLVEAGHMATENPSKEERDALAELLLEISVRLQTASTELRSELRVAA